MIRQVQRPPLVALVEDHLLLVETLRAALAQAGIASVAVPPGDPSLLAARLLALVPNLVLLDLDLGPHGDATPTVAPLVGAGIRVLVVSGIADRMRIARALEQGAIGFQSKADGFDALLTAVQAALRTDGPVRPDETAELLGELTMTRARTEVAQRPFHTLTDREQATLRQLADGHTVQQIAHAWVVSTATVRSHVHAVLHKLAVSSQLEAIALARRSGWLDDQTRHQHHGR